MIKCPICRAELTRGMPFCPICGTSLGFPFRPLIAGLFLLGICLLTLRFMSEPYCYIVAAPLAILALLPLGLTGFIFFRSLPGR